MIDYIIIGLLAIVIVLLIILIVRKNNNSEMVEKLGKFETGITKEIGEFKFSFSRNMTNDFEKLFCASVLLNGEMDRNAIKRREVIRGDNRPTFDDFKVFNTLIFIDDNLSLFDEVSEIVI